MEWGCHYGWYSNGFANGYGTKIRNGGDQKTGFWREGQLSGHNDADESIVFEFKKYLVYPDQKLVGSKRSSKMKIFQNNQFVKR